MICLKLSAIMKTRKPFALIRKWRKSMKLNNIWGYGQLFGYSGIDGVNRYYNDFIGTLAAKKIGVRFELKQWIKVHFPIKGKIKFHAITGDMIDAQTQDGSFFMTFADADTLVGYSPVLPDVSGEKKLKYQKSWNVDTWSTPFDSIALQYEKEGELYKFCLHHSQNFTEARSGANYYLQADVYALKQKRYAYFENLPKCKNSKYEQLYYKALSVNKVNVHSAEGKIPCAWTTPDRVPHRHMWLWDSVFHALAIVQYNEPLAKDAIRAVLSQQRADGFIAHMMNPLDCSDVTQPQVLAWGVWEIYQKTKDKAFLKESVFALDKYLTWDLKHRDKNGNGLLEWFTEPDYTECKCGESGLDNSPRFDFDTDMDAIDFSCFQAHDAEYLAKIYRELGDLEKAQAWQNAHDELKEKIRTQMYDEETGAFYDKLFDGELTKVLTPMSFLPMFANVCSKEQAAKMVQTMTDKTELWTEVPLATISQKHPTFSTDMWRGGVWLNLNYFIIKGLHNYGYHDLANELRLKTLDCVNKWYQKTGALFEFYDPNNRIAPYCCDRKAPARKTPDWRKQVHSIIDYNWSACFTLLFIQNELY